jgi:hypothetical protein
MQQPRVLFRRLRGFLRQPRKTVSRLLARTKPLVLVIDHAYPQTDRYAGAVCIVSHIRIFTDLGYRVMFVARDQIAKSTDYRRQLEALGVSCVGPERAASVDELLEREGSTFAICFLNSVRFGGTFYEKARSHCSSAKIIFHLSDLHYLRSGRQAKLFGDESKMAHVAETKARELELVQKADASIVVSSVEKQILNEAVPGARVFHMPLIHESPGRAGPFRSRSGVGFVASYNWPPNADAVRYLLAEIWPLVRARLPGAQLFLIGSKLPDEFTKLSDQSIVPVGYVPDLLEPLAKLRLTIAPLRYGAGAKGKVVSSLAHGVPCVLSEIAAEGMDLVDGKHMLIGRDPAHFVEQIVRLHEDEVLWDALSKAGLARAQEDHSFKAGRARMRKLLTEIQAI